MAHGTARLAPVVAPTRAVYPGTPGAHGAILKMGDVEVPGYTALVVDDDYRNVFALTALLERGGMTVIGAESGKDALVILESTPGIDIVFMDIMMPIMDGYDTMRAVRALPQFAELPIVAVTAKVMPDEEGHCIEAGASSYIPKPVDTARLLLAIGRWLPREFGHVAPAASGGRA
jgi:CheY-like chemotaxis protein